MNYNNFMKLLLQYREYKTTDKKRDIQTSKGEFILNLINNITKEKIVHINAKMDPESFARKGISASNASLILNQLDKNKFEEYIYNLIDIDKFPPLKNKLLNDYNVIVRSNNYGKILADIFENILRELANDASPEHAVKRDLREQMKQRIDTFFKQNKFYDALSSYARTENENETLNLLNLLNTENSHIYLYGEGGIGKTTALMNFARDMLLSKKNSSVPVLIKLNEYQTYNYNLKNDGLFIIKYIAKLINPKYMINTVENNFIYSIRAEFTKPAPNGIPEYILILDGLNEMSSDLKYEFMTEINEYLKGGEYTNTKVILIGRSKNNYNINNNAVKKFEFQPVKEEIIKMFLKSKDYDDNVIKDILSNQQLLECVRIPFYLCKFIDIGNDAAVSRGEILKDYYEEQKKKFENDHIKHLTIQFILDFIVPSIAHYMEKNDSYEIDKTDEFDQMVEDILDSKAEYKFENKFERSFYQSGAIGESDDINNIIKTADKNKILDILTNELCIMRYSKASDHCEFIHNNIRDYFAAAHTINMMYFALKYSKNNDFQKAFEYIKELNSHIWNKERIYFILECAEKEYLQSILDIYRDNKYTEIRDFGVRNIVNCVKLSGCTKNQNFSRLDFNNINLTGYDWGNSSFAYSKISRNTFTPQGHLNTAKNIAVADDTGECFTISKDDFILKYNINGNDTGRIFIKNFDETGKHIICSKDGGLCFVSDSEDNVWAVHTGDNDYPETKIINSRKVLRQYNGGYRLIDILLSDDGLNLYALYNNGENDNSKSLILHLQKNKNDKNYKGAPYMFEIKINCFCLFESELYFGAENGKLYKYFNGSASEKISFDNPLNCVCSGGGYIFIGQKNIDIIKYNVKTNKYIIYGYDRTEEAKLENLVLKKMFCSKDGENFGAYFDERKYFITYDKESDGMKINTDTAVDIKISCMGYYHNPKNNKSRYIICCRDNNMYIKTLNNYTVNILSGRSGLLCDSYYLAKNDSLICVFWDRSIKEFNFKEGGFVKNIIKTHGNFVDALAYIPANDCFMTCSCDKTIKLWDKDFNEIPNAFAGIHTGEINAIACSDDGKNVYSAGLSNDLGFDENNIAVGKGEFFVWRQSDDDTYSYDKVQSEIIAGKNIGIINSLACDKDGEICYAASADFNVYKYSRKENVLSQLYKDDGYIDEVACSSDGSICYSVSFLPQADKDGNKGYLIKWDSESGKQIIFGYKSESDGIKYVACNSEGDICYIGTGDGKIYVCIRDKYAGEYIIREDEAVAIGYGISKLRCSDDGKKLFAGCGNKILKYELTSNNNLKYSGEWNAIENINIIGCDFSESIIEDEELKNTIKINGGRFA